MVLVNPSDTESYTYCLDKGYNNVIPVGGGVLPENGVPDGYLTYESVNDVLILPPVSGVVLLDVAGTEHHQALAMGFKSEEAGFLR